MENKSKQIDINGDSNFFKIVLYYLTYIYYLTGCQ